MNTYQEAIDYLYNRLPMFSKQGDAAIKKDLHNIKRLCQALGNPQNTFKSIHIAGTNGKGSSSHMLTAILEKAGYRSGLYTSPHLLDFRERIRVGGEMIPEQEVIDFIKEHQVLIDSISPSFFEVTVALAFSYFSKQNIDIAVIETGLGGRLDSTNIILPILSLITNVSMDHVSILGDSIAKIAKEKAGIIKEGTPVIISEESSDSSAVFELRARECNSEILFASRQWSVERIGRNEQFQTVRVRRSPLQVDFPPLQLDLTGSYQLKNLVGVLSTVAKLEQLNYHIPLKAVEEGLANVKQLTGLMGRWQVVGQRPLIVCDTGHNDKGWQETLRNIEQERYEQLHMVIGVMHDKDITRLLEQLPVSGRYYFCQPEFERALPANELMTLARPYGLLGEAFSNISSALSAARRNARAEDMIFIGGSSFVVAEALQHFQ